MDRSNIHVEAGSRATTTLNTGVLTSLTVVAYCLEGRHFADDGFAMRLCFYESV